MRAVIYLVEDRQVVDLTQLLEHRVIEACVAILNTNCTYRKTQKSKLTQRMSIQSVHLDSGGTLHGSYRYRYDMEDGNSISSR